MIYDRVVFFPSLIPLTYVPILPSSATHHTSTGILNRDRGQVTKFVVQRNFGLMDKDRLRDRLQVELNGR